jgi:2,4-dienoyl-CoA reductase-like NADH-dependent reductase (Old Yellow Enzyme family)
MTIVQNTALAGGIATPFTLPNGSQLINRLAKASMSEGLATPTNGVSDGLIALYQRWGQRGAGLLLTGNIQINRRHLERTGNVVFDNLMTVDEKRMAANWAQTAQAGGSQLWAQISHAGRQTPKAVNAMPDSSSALSVKLPGGKYGNPEPMNETEIRAAIAGFARAAAVAEEAGFSGVQLHGAHGYLINQFLSPLSNTRHDRWGGSLENRARLLIEAVRAIRQTVGKGFGVGVKLNSSDFQRGGFDAADAARVAQWLDAEGLDLLEVSGGTYESPAMASGEGGTLSDGFEQLTRSTAAREAYFLTYAAAIRTQVKCPIMVTGGFRSLAGMNSALADNATDIIGIGRPLASDPDCVARMLAGEITELPAMERSLRLGAPSFLGPNSSFKMMKGLNTLAVLEWHCLQLLRLGRGQQADRQLGLFKGFRRFEAQEKAINGAWQPIEAWDRFASAKGQ